MADDEDERTGEADVVWEGDCLEVVRTFPKPIREDLGADIRRMQLGERPLSSRSMTYMLHAFMKKSAKTSPNDLRIAGARLKVVNARLLKEKKNARKSK